MMIQSDIRILVADDHGIIRMGLIQILKSLWPRATFTEAEDFREFQTLISKQIFDLAILDVNMPNGSLQQALEYKKIKQPDLKILVFSSQDESMYAVRYLQMGADGFLNKLSSKETIDKAVSSMMSKGRYMSEEIKDTMIERSFQKNPDLSPLETLSNRELEVAHKLAEGLPLKELSEQLNLHPSTVSTYKNRIFKKLEVQSVVDLIAVMNVYQ